MFFRMFDIRLNETLSELFHMKQNYEDKLLKPSLSMEILSINNFTIKLLSILLSDLFIGVHLKSSFDPKKFGSKVNNRQ